MNIKYIRNYLAINCGNDVKVIYNAPRNKKEKYTGVLWKVYNNIFLIKLTNSEVKCFSYNDVLTKTVKLFI